MVGDGRVGEAAVHGPDAGIVGHGPLCDDDAVVGAVPRAEVGVGRVGHQPVVVAADDEAVQLLGDGIAAAGIEVSESDDVVLIGIALLGP